MPFGSPGSGAGQLSITYFREANGGKPITGGSGLAVDEATGDVYVADTGNNRIDEFTAAGGFVRAWGWGVRTGASEPQVCTEESGCEIGVAGTNPGEFEAPAFVAVDNSPGGEDDIYVVDENGDGFGSAVESKSLVQKFNPAGELIESWGSKGQLTASSISSTSGSFGSFGLVGGIAVISSGRLLLATNNGIYEFAQSSGAYIGRLGSETTVVTNGFAVDALGHSYIPEGGARRNGLVARDSSVGISEGYLYEIGEMSVSKVGTGIAVAPSGELYIDEGNAIQVLAPSCMPTGNFAPPFCLPVTSFSSPLLTGGAGLAVDSQHETVYIAETAGQKIESIVPEPPSVPLVEAGTESVSDVSGDSVTLEAAISPRSEPNEEPASYRFQYTTQEDFQREGFAGATSVPVPDGELAPSFESDVVTAHAQGLQSGTVYRYRVVAENAISRKDGEPTEGERDEAGEEIARTFTTQSPGGFFLPDGRTWELVSPANKHGALIEPIKGDGVVQASASGDALTYLSTAPTESGGAEGNSNSNQALSTRGAGVSSWGSRDLATPREVANGAGQIFSEYQFFSSDLSLSIVHPYGAFNPAMSAEASEQTPYLRTNFSSGDTTLPCLSSCYRPLATGSPGFENVPEGTEFGEGTCTPGPGGSSFECGPTVSGATPDAGHIVLKSRVSLTEGAPENALYEWSEGRLELVSVLPGGEPAEQPAGLGYRDGRMNDGNRRNAISVDGSRVVWEARTTLRSLYLRDMVREETVQIAAPGAEFQDASSDDSRVFYTWNGDLYEFEAPVGQALSAGHVVNLTPGGGLLGFVIGVSKDGSYAYFASASVLSGGEANARGETALAGQPNLYVENEGTIKLIAVLSNRDQGNWTDSAHSFAYLKELTAGVSPDGRRLAFMSERPLTGYDNRDVVSGERDEEIFLYDATGNGDRGTVVCTSCDPTGARPHGLLEANTVTRALLVDGQQAWAGRWFAANLPGWTTPVYRSRYLSDSGRLFFNSDDALVPSDTNGTEDVYEYEPSGVGNCTNASTTFSPQAGGCVDLVSSGTSKEESAFMDASESGDDVFILTSAELSRQDTDSIPDVYDARVDGGSLEPEAPPACEGDACQSPVAAPEDPTPGSLTYSGPGNPSPLLAPRKVTAKKSLKCAKGKKPVRGKCVKVKKKAKKTTNRAGTKRGVRS